MRKLVMVAAALVLSSCASMRKVDIGGNEPARNFFVEVTNARSSTVTVSYAAGSDRIELGSVAPQRMERFIVPAAEGSSVTIMAVTSGGASAGNYPVTVSGGTTRKITIR